MLIGKSIGMIWYYKSGSEEFIRGVNVSITFVWTLLRIGDEFIGEVYRALSVTKD